MPTPARRRLLRASAGAGASLGHQGLPSGSSACWSSKATPGKGTPLPLFWSLRLDHLHWGQAQF